MLLRKSGQVIPHRIEYYGVPRVFDMLCKESTSALKMKNVYDCLARLGISAVPRKMMEMLGDKYVYDHRLADFQSFEGILRAFRDRNVLGINASRPFEELRAEMNRLVYLEGKTWEEAADAAAGTINLSSGMCACGNPSAKLCVLNKCGLCCHKSSVTCARHRK